jgi:hypothetical protein
MRLVFGIFWIALVAGALSACSGGDDGSSNGPTADGASAGPTARSGAGSLEQLAAKYAAGVDDYVKYSVDSDNWGVHPKGTWSTYRLGSKVREDWTTNTYGYDETNIAINTGDAFIFCASTQFAQDCRREEKAAALDLIFAIFTSVKEVPAALLSPDTKYQASELPDETIGGVTAKCFDIAVDGRIGVGKAGTETMKLCFGEDGAILSFDRRVKFDDPALPVARLTAIGQDTRESTPADFENPGTPAPSR